MSTAPATQTCRFLASDVREFTVQNLRAALEREHGRPLTSGEESALRSACWHSQEMITLITALMNGEIETKH